MPQQIVISRMPMRSWTCRITSIGQGEPAMTPVRSGVSLNASNSG